jgi:hypothetical protein
MTRFVTILTPDFWPGFAALLQSFSENSGFTTTDSEFLVFCDLPEAPMDWIAQRKEAITLVSRAKIPAIPILSPQAQGSRMEESLQKLGVFALDPSLGKCVYIDSDMVCLSSLTELREIEPFAGVCDELCGFDTMIDPQLRPDFEINGGLFVFRPDPKDFSQLLATYQARHDEARFKADQDVINMWLRDQKHPVRRLGSEWNFSKRFQNGLGRAWIEARRDQIKILHFVGLKPWTPNAEINTFHECHYRWLEEIWWDYFERSGFAKFMKSPPKRSIAFVRQSILPFTKPVILREHATRVARFARRKFLGC